MTKSAPPSDRSSSSVEAWMQNIELLDELPEHRNDYCEPPAYSPLEQSPNLVPETQPHVHSCCAYVSLGEREIASLN